MLYLILSPSCLSQMEVPYLINNSPDFMGEQPHDLHWASYEINGNTVDGEYGHFGTVRVHDDYWNIDNEDKQFYNFNIRNSMELSYEDYIALEKHFTNKYNNISLLLHADNIEEIYAWCNNTKVIIIGAAMGSWFNDLEYWAMREFNTVMEDDRNANYSDNNHVFINNDDVLDRFWHRKEADLSWRNRISSFADITLWQSDWCQFENISRIYQYLGITPPSRKWIKTYYTVFQDKQDYAVENLVALRKSYNIRESYYGRC